jgi:SAM-dependent methyltransferase
MSDETSKANKRRINTYLYNKVFSGDGIDIGSGGDILKKEIYPNIKSVEPFDLEHGDAQYINKYINKQFDFVHSSQCLEHMVDANVALVNWWNLVKPGGYLIFSMPDEDLYEQGVFPSRWNHDHKWTFSIYKSNSWSPVHLNILDMIFRLEKQEIIKIELIDTNYNYTLSNVDQTRNDVEAFIEVILKKKVE